MQSKVSKERESMRERETLDPRIADNLTFRTLCGIHIITSACAFAVCCVRLDLFEQG